MLPSDKTNNAFVAVDELYAGNGDVLVMNSSYIPMIEDITGYDVNTRDGFESIEKVLKSDNCEDTI